MEVLPEPSTVLQIIAIWFIPFLAYYLGIYIGKAAFPDPDSPSLYAQMLLGIPVCLIVVSPMIYALRSAIGSHVPTYLFTLGIIIEHGMIVHETAAKHLEEQLRRLRQHS